MDRSELAGLSAEELIAKRDTIEEEIRKQHELLDMVRTCLTSCIGWSLAPYNLTAPTGVTVWSQVAKVFLVGHKDNSHPM